MVSIPQQRPGMVARCRVYLFTYRRPELLRRAIKSLLDQTFAGWVCEVHNDDPTDERPKQVLAECSDPRITLVTHPEKYGPTKTFNCAFVPVSEDYVSILEDDNSWDPDFLTCCIECLDKNPEASMVWANMQLWQQVDETTCKPTEMLFWPERSKKGNALPPTTSFRWPNCRCLSGCLHSTGAMVFRSKYAPEYIVPDECPSNFFEHVRERTFRYPIILVRRKLANWTWTISTSRPSSLSLSVALRIMLANSYLLHCGKSHFSLLRIWAVARRRKQRHLIILVLAILSNLRLWPLFRYLKFADLPWLCVDFGRHPFATMGAFVQMRRLANLRRFVETKTRQQRW